MEFVSTKARLVAGLLSVGLFALPAQSMARPTVIFLSWDGVRHDYPERVQLPGLERMARDGLRAERLRPVFPSNTFPNHAALATGTYPDRHGIIDNRFYDRKRGVYDYGRGEPGAWLEAEPLWATAERQGVPAAVFFWVGSQNPWKGRMPAEAKVPFDEGVSEEEKVDQIFAWLDRPSDTRPGLIMSWWRGADSVAHRWGPDAPGIGEALQDQDAQLRRLFAGIEERGMWKDVTVVVASDHGMTEATEMVDVVGALKKEGVEARVSTGSSVAHVFLGDHGDLERATEVLSGQGLRVYPANEIPQSWRVRHAERTGDLVALVDPPRTFHRDSLARAFLWLRRTLDSSAGLGMHGYAPDHPDMGAILFAVGRGVPAGARPGQVDTIDVAPTVAALLGIEPPEQSEGRVIEVVGRELGEMRARGVEADAQAESEAAPTRPTLPQARTAPPSRPASTR